MINYSPEEPVSSVAVGFNEPSCPALTQPLELATDEVHLWLAHLDHHSADTLKPLLADDEVSRADRFHFTKDRNPYIVARGLLRKLLAAYLELSPAELSFAYTEKGKPSLKTEQGRSLNFNLAHSGGLAIYAFSRGREIGVDLEFIREDLADDKIAERFFSRREIDALKTVAADLRKQAFFNCWTRKEAYIKARGEGLSMPLDEFDVSLVPGEPAALLRNHKEPAEVSRWSMQSVAVPDGYVAALVASGRDWSTKTFALDSLR